MTGVQTCALPICADEDRDENDEVRDVVEHEREERVHVAAAAISPDGRFVALLGPARVAKIYPVDGSAAQRISGVEPEDVPIQWSADGKSLYVTRRGELPARIERLDLATGKKEFWKELMPADRAGLIRIDSVFVTPDGKSYAYTASRGLASDLYLVSGLK